MGPGLERHLLPENALGMDRPLSLSPVHPQDAIEEAKVVSFASGRRQTR